MRNARKWRNSSRILHIFIKDTYTRDMSKKNFIIQMLETLRAKRSLAGEFLKYINMGAMNNDAVNAMAELLRDMAKYMNNDEKKHHLEKAAELLERLKTKELEEMAIDQSEAESLLASL